MEDVQTLCPCGCGRMPPPPGVSPCLCPCGHTCSPCGGRASSGFDLCQSCFRGCFLPLWSSVPEFAAVYRRGDTAQFAQLALGQFRQQFLQLLADRRGS